MALSAPKLLALVILSCVFSFLPCLGSVPQEAIDFYNQACDASQSGDQGAAQTAFAQALSAGFDDFRYASDDPDLKAFTSTPAYKDLLLSHQSMLTLLSSERGFNLEEGQWTNWEKLEAITEEKDSASEVRLLWKSLGLDYEIRVSGPLADEFSQAKAPPEAGGPSLMLSILIPDGTSAYESSNAFHFLLGKSKISVTGSLYMNPGWQLVNELTPAISDPEKDHTITISGFIPWQIILPYHPLVDTTIGLNISIQSNASGQDGQVLFPDPHSFSPAAEIYRFVPMNFKIDTATNEAMVGKMSQSIIGDDPLICDLTVISNESGSAFLKMDFLDERGNSVLPEGAVRQPRTVLAGANIISQSADFQALKPGPYLVKIDLELPSGNQLVWSSMILNMGSHWEEKFQTRMASLQEKDQPTARYYLDTIIAAVENLPSRRHPGSLSTTFRELDSFLEAGKDQGNILPEKGVFLLTWTDDHDNQRFCSLYLPDGHRQADALDPVVLWSNAPGFERRLASRVGKFSEYPRPKPTPPKAEDRKFPVYLVPHSPAEAYGSLAEEVSDLDSCLQWVRSYFSTETVSLAGMDKAAGAVLQYSLNKPETLSRILIYSGSQLNPWPESTAEDLKPKFPAKAPGFPAMTWIDFYIETQTFGQGKLLLSVLEDAGYIVSPVQRVKGGPSLTQVTDRLVLWAE